MQVHMLTKEVKPGVFPLPLGVYFIGFPFGAPLEVLFVFGFFFFSRSILHLHICSSSSRGRNLDKKMNVGF
jgi:hypothetical protein